MVHVPSGRRPAQRRRRAVQVPERSLSDLASEDPRWERLLCDPDNMFCGDECVGGAYRQYLMDVVTVMEDYDCCFREAVVLAAKLDAEEAACPCSEAPGCERRGSEASAHGRERAGVADFLRARREGMPMHKALVYNMKAAPLGPARAELCAWRRREAHDAVAKCQAAVALASSSLAKGWRCSDQELVELGASLRTASELCHKLDYALEILEANSRACGEGDEVLGEYSQLFADGADCVSGARRTTGQLAAVRRSKYPMEHAASRLSELCARVCGGCPQKKARRPTVSPPTTPSPRR